MHAINLHVNHDDGPEANECSGEPLVFDPRDAASMQRTQKILRERFGLPVAPPLFGNQGSRFVAAIRRRVASLLRRFERRPRLRVA